MRGIFLYFGLWLTAATLLSAQAPTDDVPLIFARLDLMDGRKLKNVVVKSYDAKSEKLLIVADRKAMTVPIALVPPPFNQQLKSAPSSGGFFNVQSTPAPSMPTAADQYGAATTTFPSPEKRPVYVVPKSPARSAPPRRNTQSPVVYVNPTDGSGPVHPQVLANHAEAMRNRATLYFRYEFQIGSNSIRVTSLDFELSQPKPVPGWEGRFESQGKAFVEFFDSKGWSTQRTTRIFEVVSEQKPGEPINVLQFTLKN